MSITITLPDFLTAKLLERARASCRSEADLAIELLDEALESKQTDDSFHLTLEEVVARIKSLPPNPNAVRPAIGSLAEYLAGSIASEDPNEEFDLAEWQREWNAVEAEMKAVERANDIAEGLF